MGVSEVSMEKNNGIDQCYNYLFADGNVFVKQKGRGIILYIYIHTQKKKIRRKNHDHFRKKVESKNEPGFQRKWAR